jgi:hypothetical protein
MTCGSFQVCCHDRHDVVFCRLLAVVGIAVSLRSSQWQGESTDPPPWIQMTS